jgi:hypothetical protein
VVKHAAVLAGQLAGNLSLAGKAIEAAVRAVGAAEQLQDTFH